MRQLTKNDLLEVERELCKRSFASFIKRAWPQIIPDQYVHGWHIDAMAEHFEAVAAGEITRLLINVPPGTSKSTITGIMYPAWLWGPKGQPGHKYIGAAHEQGLAVRDNRLMRELILSPWYQKLWPIELQGDQNEKLYFENKDRGFRQACAVESMTGRRGHTIAWDDPLSPKKADSQAGRQAAIDMLTGTLPTRLNDPKKSAIIVVMQRLHEDDPSGYILSNDLGYDHLCLPMEFEPDRKCITSIGWQDPRKTEGELLFPERFPQEVVDRDKKAMGSYAWAGQARQRPRPAEGGSFFQKAWFEIVDAAPVGQTVRAWDLAGSEKVRNSEPDWTTGVRMVKTPDGLFYVDDVIRFRGRPEEVERTILNTASQDGVNVSIRIPQDPGQAGKAQAGHLTRMLAGYSVKALPVSGSKVTRAKPLSAQVEAGNVRIVRGAWNDDFIDELEAFPQGRFDDQVDAVSDAFNDLTATRKIIVRG